MSLTEFGKQVDGGWWWKEDGCVFDGNLGDEWLVAGKKLSDVSFDGEI